MLPGNQKGLQSYTAEDVKKRIPPRLVNRPPGQKMMQIT